MLTAMAAEFCREYEEVAESTRHTRSLDDLLKRNCGKTVEPAENYTDLKLNIGTYCGLLWTIFGNHCDYYKELLKIHHILDREECFTVRNAYTKEICARITCGIVDEGCSFFGKTPLCWTSHQGRCLISPPVFWRGSRIQFAMQSRFNGQCSPMNGWPHLKHRTHCMAGHRRGRPLPGDQHRPYRRYPWEDPHQQDQDRRTSATQKSNS